jgi:hypothetical protein
MNIVDWAKQNKAAAAGIGGLGLLFVMSKGHASAGASVSSSDGTADGAPADGEHVQLIPVSSGPAEGADPTSDPTLGGSSSGTVDPGYSPGDYPLGPGGVSVGGDINSPLLPDNTPAQPNPAPIVNVIMPGPRQSAAVAGHAGTKASTHPPGHPGYTTVTQASPAHSGRQDTYHVYKNAQGKVTRKVDVGPAARHPAPVVHKPAPKPPPPPPPRRPAPAPKRAPAKRR